MSLSFRPTKAARALEFTNASKVITRRVQYLAAKYIDGPRDQGGRADIDTISSSGRTPVEGFSAGIREKIGVDPDLSARSIAHSLEIITSSVCRHLRRVLGMKYCHL